jgi:hypothetical protein
VLVADDASGWDQGVQLRRCFRRRVSQNEGWIDLVPRLLFTLSSDPVKAEPPPPAPGLAVCCSHLSFSPLGPGYSQP